MSFNENFYVPVCVRMCLFSRLGRSKAFPHTSHGNMARSPRVGLAFGDDFGKEIVVSCKSPVLLAPDDVRESPEIDLCSSSPLDGGEMGNMMRDRRDIERSRGESKSFFKKFRRLVR